MESIKVLKYYEFKSKLELEILTDIHDSYQATEVAKVVDILQPAFYADKLT